MFNLLFYTYPTHTVKIHFFRPFDSCIINNLKLIQIYNPEYSNIECITQRNPSEKVKTKLGMGDECTKKKKGTKCLDE